MRIIALWWRKRRLASQYAKAQRLVNAIDASMKILGYSRSQRKGLWRDFIKSEETRKWFFVSYIEDLLGKRGSTKGDSHGE
jgi:hypothetical protein